VVLLLASLAKFHKVNQKWQSTLTPAQLMSSKRRGRALRARPSARPHRPRGLSGGIAKRHEHQSSSVNPCLRALARDRCLPSSFFGPVLHGAFKTAICRKPEQRDHAITLQSCLWGKSVWSGFALQTRAWPFYSHLWSRSSYSLAGLSG
jgi:hypothetical protein